MPNIRNRLALAAANPSPAKTDTPLRARVLLSAFWIPAPALSARRDLASERGSSQLSTSSMRHIVFSLS